MFAYAGLSVEPGFKILPAVPEPVPTVEPKVTADSSIKLEVPVLYRTVFANATVNACEPVA